MPLYPPERKKLDPKDYEKVPITDFVTGEILEVQHKVEHLFGGKPPKTGPAVRFKFSIDGLKHSHYSRWMGFSYSEKSNLFSKYLVALVEDAKEYMMFDIQALKGLRVKMFWQENPKNKDYQEIKIILPLEGKVLASAVTPEPTEEVPF